MAAQEGLRGRKSLAEPGGAAQPPEAVGPRGVWAQAVTGHRMGPQMTRIHPVPVRGGRSRLGGPFAAALAFALLVAIAGPSASQEILAEAPPEALAAGSGDDAAALGFETRAAIPGLGTPASGWVVDEAGLLSAEVVRALDVRLADHEAATSNQVVVLTVPSLGGLEIEEFANGEANRRGIGQKGRDNGVLFVVAPNERAARIEVGYGLEAVLTDARAGRILRVDVVPRFREGDYAGGIDAGLTAILATLDGSYTPTLADRFPFQGLLAWFDRRPDLTLFEQVFLGMFFFLFGPILAILPLGWLRWKGLGAWIGLALFAFLAALVVRRYPWMPAGILLFGAFLALGWLDKKSGGRLLGGGRGGGSAGGRDGGSRSGGGRSFSSSSSRSFSGGGGSFGGGGASSRW